MRLDRDPVKMNGKRVGRKGYMLGDTALKFLFPTSEDGRALDIEKLV